MKIKMNKFNILFESIMRDMLEIDWQSNDEFDVKVIGKLDVDVEKYNQLFESSGCLWSIICLH